MAWLPAILAVIVHTALSAFLLLQSWETMRPHVPTPRIKPPPILWSFETLEFEKFVTELQSEQKKLEEREQELEKLNAAIKAERRELEKVRNDIQTARNALSSSVIELEQGEAKNLKFLVTTYSSLPPQSAVNLFLEMDEPTVVKILALMKTDKVSAIFQEMAKPRGPDQSMAKRAAQLADKLRLLSAAKEAQKP